MSYTNTDNTKTKNSDITYIRKAMHAPLLEKEHELALARRWKDKGDEQALHELIESYTRLVVSYAKKFRHYGLASSDLIQEGNIGLMEAAKRFDPDRDLRFSTYAAWWVRASMQEYVLKNWSIVRTGTTAAQKTLFFKLRHLHNKIEQQKEQAGLDKKDIHDIARSLGVRIKDVEDMHARLSSYDQSLNTPITSHQGDGTSQEEIVSLLPSSMPTPEETVIGMKDAESRSAWLNSALNNLDNREQKIIRDRHLQNETVTLEALGKELGVSKERVRQLESRALEKLKTSMISSNYNAQDFLSDS